MSLHLRAGRLTIDQAGQPVFDTEDKFYHNITTTGLSGSYTVPTRAVSNWGKIDVDTNHLIGSCNAFCTHVCGSVRFDGVDQVIPAGVWFAYEGGDLFFIVSKVTGIQNPAYSTRVTGLAKYRFFVSGGSVYLNERAFFTSSMMMTIPTHVISWKLKAGRFT